MKIRTVLPDRTRSCGLIIRNVTAEYHTGSGSDCIDVYGEMTDSPSCRLSFEPEVCCSILNSRGEIRYACEGSHHGYFRDSHYSVFHIRIENVSEKIDPRQIHSVKLFVVGCKEDYWD